MKCDTVLTHSQKTLTGLFRRRLEFRGSNLTLDTLPTSSTSSTPLHLYPDLQRSFINCTLHQMLSNQGGYDWWDL